MTTSSTPPKPPLPPPLRAVLPPLFWLGLWQFGALGLDKAMRGRGNELLLPYPATVLSALLRLMGTSSFWLTVLATLGRVSAGLAIGTLLGLLLAGLTASSTVLDLLLSPAVRVVRATPVASFIILVMLWLRRDLAPVIISCTMLLPVIWENTRRGISELDEKLLEMAAAYRFSSWQRLRLIVLPSLRPYFLAGLTSALGLAWKSGVAAEVLCLPRRAMGTQIYRTKLDLEVPELFAWTLTVVVLSLLLERLLRSTLGRRRPC